MSLTIHCWQLSALLEQSFRRHPATEALNQTQLLILLFLLKEARRGGSRRGATPTGIAAAIGCARTRTSMQLKTMVGLELVEDSASTARLDKNAELLGDRRQRYFCLTKHGTLVARKAAAAVEWVDREIRRSVTAKKHDAAVTTLAAARDALEQAPFFVAGRLLAGRGRAR